MLQDAAIEDGRAAPLDDKDALTAHGADERMPAASLAARVRLLHEIVMEAAARK